MQKNRGVSFVLGRRVLMYKGENDKVEKIHLKGKTISTDHIIYFPNNQRANTDMFIKSNFNSDLNIGVQRKIQTGEFMASDIKRIFAAGRCALVPFFGHTEMLEDVDHGMNINQGVFTAYNILGLGIPYSVVPYRDFDFYGNIFREAGYFRYYEKAITIGDLNDFDYTCYYTGQGTGIFKAVGFQKDPNHMNIIREAIRLGQPIEPDRESPMMFDEVKIPKLLKAIRVL